MLKPRGHNVLALKSIAGWRLPPGRLHGWDAQSIFDLTKSGLK